MKSSILIAGAVLVFGVLTLYDRAGGTSRERYYERPRLSELSPEEYADLREERGLMRVFGIRYKPDPCRLEKIDEGGEYVAENLVLLCGPLFLPFGTTEQ